MKNISQEDTTELADLLDMSTVQRERDDQNDSDFWVSNYMDAFASMKKKMQEKHQVFKEWNERRGEEKGWWVVLMSSKLAFSSLKYHWDI